MVVLAGSTVVGVVVWLIVVVVWLVVVVVWLVVAVVWLVVAVVPDIVVPAVVTAFGSASEKVRNTAGPIILCWLFITKSPRRQRQFRLLLWTYG